MFMNYDRLIYKIYTYLPFLEVSVTFTICGQWFNVFEKYGFVTPMIIRGGFRDLLIYSLNSLSCIVKYGL